MSHNEIDQDTLSLLARIHHDEREFNIFFNWFNKYLQERKENEMDTSSNVAVSLSTLKVGDNITFIPFRLNGTPKYDGFTLKIQRGIPVEYHQKFPNHEALVNTYFLSIWKGEKKVSTSQISGDIETIGLIARLIMKKGVNEGQVNPKTPNGTKAVVPETYNF